MRHGFLLIDKPAGSTSHDVVAKVRHTLHERSVGHLGTLDPSATGLLALAVGRKALKVVELLSGMPKEYVADVRFGSVSTTYDAEGMIDSVVPPKGWKEPTDIEVRNLITDRFIGKISQVPPAFSAVHVGGERAYRKARQGKSVDIPAREVEITACDILSYTYPDLRLRVACGSGTYIRSLAHDLGQLLHCGGHLRALRRTKIGGWSVEQATPVDRIAWANIMPLKEILTPFLRRDLSPSDMDELTHGRNIEGEVEKGTIGWFDDLPVAILEPKGEGFIHARKVF